MTIGQNIPVYRSEQEVQQIFKSEFAKYSLDHVSISIIIRHLRMKYPEYCDECHNTGMIFNIVNNELKSSKCLCKQYFENVQKYRKNLENSNIPIKYRSFSIDKWVNPGRNPLEKEYNNKSMKVIVNYIDGILKYVHMGYGLFICGPNGVGKTFLACEIAKAAIWNGLTARFYTLAKIISLTTEGWYDLDVKRQDVKSIELCDILVVDDADKIYKTKVGLEIALFDNMFRERLQNNRPVIFTSNSKIQDMNGSFNESIHSMFLEQSAEVVFIGVDNRNRMSAQIRRVIEDAK